MNWTKIARCTAVAIGTAFVVAAAAFLVIHISSSISDGPPRWNVSQVSALLLMHPAARLQFERAAREFAQWRAVPEDERSPAPAWWWQPAFEVAAHQEQMPPLWCHLLELPLSSTYAAGAAVLMSTLVDQTSLPWPDEFPRKIERAEKLEGC